MSTKSIAKFFVEKIGQLLEKILPLKIILRHQTKESYKRNYPGARNLIEKLTEKNIPFGIVSNAPKKVYCKVS